MRCPNLPSICHNHHILTQKQQAEILPGPGAASLGELLRGERSSSGEGEGPLTLLYAYGPLDVDCLHHHHHHHHHHQHSCPPRDLLAHLPLPACLGIAAGAAESESTTVVAANLWLGANVTSRIHVDAHDNLLCVAAGAKLVHLYSPFDIGPLALGPPDRLPVESGLKSVLFHSPQTWPVGLERSVARVEAGEALFIPAGWAHEVFTIAAPYTAAVSLWCANPHPPRIRLRPALLHLASDGRFGAFVAAAAAAEADGPARGGQKRGRELDVEAEEAGSD